MLKKNVCTKPVTELLYHNSVLTIFNMYWAYPNLVLKKIMIKPNNQTYIASVFIDICSNLEIKILSHHSSVTPLLTLFHLNSLCRCYVCYQTSQQQHGVNLAHCRVSISWGWICYSGCRKQQRSVKIQHGSINNVFIFLIHMLMFPKQAFREPRMYYT